MPFFTARLLVESRGYSQGGPAVQATPCRSRKGARRLVGPGLPCYIGPTAVLLIVRPSIASAPASARSEASTRASTARPTSRSLRHLRVILGFLAPYRLQVAVAVVALVVAAATVL